MNDAVLNAVQVSPSEKISFRCTGCSACCRHVRQSVVLESLDVFRITKYLRDRDSNIKSTDDFLEKHAEIALLDECGFSYLCSKCRMRTTHAFSSRRTAA